jgi:hypothetical protein
MFTPGASFDGVLVLSSLKKIGEVAVLLVVLEKQIFFFGCWFAERDWQCEVRLPPFPLFTLEIFDTKARRGECIATNTQGDRKYSGNRFEVKQHRKLNGVYLSVILMLDPSFSHST